MIKGKEGPHKQTSLIGAHPLILEKKHDTGEDTPSLLSLGELQDVNLQRFT